MTKLKPCPFCGEAYSVEVMSEEEITGVQDLKGDTTSHMVVCSVRSGGCGAGGGYYGSEERAVEAWNRRVKGSAQNDNHRN